MERNVLGWYLMRPEITMADADGMRRTMPTHLDYFDDFLFPATAMAIGEGDGYTLARACLDYRSVVKAELDSTPPLVPPAVAAVVSYIVGRFENRVPGDQRVRHRGSITRTQLDLAEEMWMSSVTALMPQARVYTARCSPLASPTGSFTPWWEPTSRAIPLQHLHSGPGPATPSPSSTTSTPLSAPGSRRRSTGPAPNAPSSLQHTPSVGLAEAYSMSAAQHRARKIPRGPDADCLKIGL
ncbi:hypothetical protein [Rhodococcoides corynebacterioides]|uniref:hypothetical protein n=2 Tax=Rhodococcoides corynebacterioides TaxID=53972 RepID=UPI00111497A9|nr:hypothetical protein [Rhodococcus corynebacterioides]